MTPATLIREIGDYKRRGKLTRASEIPTIMMLGDIGKVFLSYKEGDTTAASDALANAMLSLSVWCGIYDGGWSWQTADESAPRGLRSRQILGRCLDALLKMCEQEHKIITGQEVEAMSSIRIAQDMATALQAAANVKRIPLQYVTVKMWEYCKKLADENDKRKR